MKNFDKLYIHLFTKGIEHYRDSKTVINKIHDILNTNDDILFKNLHNAFNQAKRLNLLSEHNIPTTIESIGKRDINAPNSLLEDLLKDSIDINDLKSIIIKQISNVE